jgi:SAM-dependent methyltransferase
VNTDTEALEVLLRHRRVWEQKPVLRRIYNEEFFARLLSSRTPGGISIEIGGGPGFFKQLFPEVISTDLIPCPWLDVVADAQALPFQASTVTNVLGLDVLHHLAAPMKFLQEAERILVPGGRLVLVEPWITSFSRLIYRYFHQEDCDVSAQPWKLDDPDTPQGKKAFDGNQAIPYLLFGAGNRQNTLAALPYLQCIKAEPFCLFAYLLSFGFKPMNLLPEMSYPFLSRLERLSLPLWRRFAALRVLLVLEKSREPQMARKTNSGRAAASQG